MIILSVALASCSKEGANPPPVSNGTAEVLTTAPYVGKLVTEEMLPPASTGTAAVLTTTPYLEKSATVTPSWAQGALVVAFGDPVPIGRGGIRDAAFSPDRKTLAIGWTNGVSFTRVADQADLWYWEAPEMLTAVDASAEHVGVLLVNGDVWLLDAESGSSQRFPEAARVPGGDASWGDVAWSPDGRLAAIQAIGGVETGATPILLLDPVSDEITELSGSLTDPGWEPYLVWSPDSQMIASADQDGRGWVLDVSSGEVVFEVQPDAQGGSPRIYAWMPDSSVVIVGSAGDSLRLEDIATGEVRRRLPGAEVGFPPTPPVVISPNGDLALVGGYSIQEYEILPY